MGLYRYISFKYPNRIEDIAIKNHLYFAYPNQFSENDALDCKMLGFLSTSLTMAGIIISVAAFSISENNEYRISKNDLLGFRICGPSLLAVSIPLNIISWRKWKESYLYKKSTEKQIQ